MPNLHCAPPLPLNPTIHLHLSVPLPLFLPFPWDRLCDDDLDNLASKLTNLFHPLSPLSNSLPPFVQFPRRNINLQNGR